MSKDEMQQAIRELVKELRTWMPERGISLAITNLQQAAHWVGHVEQVDEED